MKIRSLETFKITLPFRFSFGHSLASRAESSNLIVKITLNNGCVGYGEGIPRDYVTGENIETAENNVLLKYAPHIIGLDMDEPKAIVNSLANSFKELGLEEKAQGASWCALELAVLDVCSRFHGMPVSDLIGKRKLQRIRYDGVIPFGKKKALKAVLWFYKLYGFHTVKLKVGGAPLEDDIEKLKIARQILGNDCIIRVDANCAWTLDEAMKAAEAFRPFSVKSFEQPLPANNWEGLKKLSDAIEEEVLVDESLCTIKQAKDLAENKICDAFNVRVSKAGGLLPSQEIINIALHNGLKVHLGAQVGETGILSAAARQLACVNEPMENYEGSANMFLLKKDICKENLTCGIGAYGDFKYAGKTPGLGVNIIESNLLAMTNAEFETRPDSTDALQHAESALSQEAR
ncbi:MAG: hypothetical protein K2X81_25460 [Candidatus Obscuribacterales bacterium]|nr:hypothetical protein [Candidatus Obscuribacterales bacterium]